MKTTSDEGILVIKGGKRYLCHKGKYRRCFEDLLEERFNLLNEASLKLLEECPLPVRCQADAFERFKKIFKEVNRPFDEEFDEI
jgi:hypothetical protein